MSYIEKESLTSEGSEWVLEPNLEGARSLVTVYEDGMIFWRRDISETTFFPERFNCVLLKRGEDLVESDDESLSDLFLKLCGTVFDVRIFYGGSAGVDSSVRGGKSNKSERVLRSDMAKVAQFKEPVNIHIIDVLSYIGNDVDQKLLDERLGYRSELLKLFKEEYGLVNFDVPELVSKNKEEGYSKFLSGGYDGVIYKNLESKYHALESRKKNVWVKRKPSMDGEDLKIFQGIFGGTKKKYDSEMGYVVEGYYVIAFDMQFRPLNVGILDRASLLVDTRLHDENDPRKLMSSENYWRGSTFIGRGWNPESMSFNELRLFGNRPITEKTLEEVSHPFL